jgi:serine/threonine-protein kinase
MFCVHCGAQISARQARFCSACGGALEVEAATLGPSRTRARTPAGVGFGPGDGGPGPSGFAEEEISANAPTVAAADPGRRPSSSSGWLTASDSISHGDFPPGAILEGRYRVIGLLGRGGMGEVYRADDLRLGQPVALKFLPDSVRHDPVRLAQFHNEVRTARQVSHPNVCRVHDIGEAAGRLFLSMEYVDGEDLAGSLRRIGRFPEDKALDIARQLCAGLAAAHERGVLHRDLKPANIMLDGTGKVRVMDFGLAAVGAVEDVRAGTPAYMSPEQLLGREVTARSDLFALGLVLYELFTGRRAFAAATLAELVDQHQGGQLTPPHAIVSTLDPTVERAILRCLEPSPARRPSSALAVSAALPGGDPLAAALAAGETPSPEMVAAAGEGTGVSRGTAFAAFAAIIAGIAASFVMTIRTSPLVPLDPSLTPDVLAQKAREAIRHLGYTDPAQDEAYAFEWNGTLIDHLGGEVASRNGWLGALPQRPSPLLFWYRHSNATMTAREFHSDLLTPGIITPTDPAPGAAGTIVMRLDHQGFLTYLEAIPRQVQERSPSTPPVDWGPLLALAGLDPARLQRTEPQWNWLAASDTRAAWTGTWPDSGRPLRVEAAALEGRPVAFAAMGPWTRPWRESTASTGREIVMVLVLFGLALALLVGGSVLARSNLREGRGDRGGALTLATIVTTAWLILWMCRVHAVPSIGLLGMFLLAVCTSVFYGVLFWAVYLAVEPFVRRHWPQTLVSWTTLMAGRTRDQVVWRDILFGVGVGLATALLIRGADILAGDTIVWPAVEPLLGVRATIGQVLTQAIYGTRTALFMVFLLVIIRVIVRRERTAAVAFVLIFVLLNTLEGDQPFVTAANAALYFTLLAVTVLRWGLTSLAVGITIANLMLALPATTDLSAWYIGQSMLHVAIPLGLASWAFYMSVRTRAAAPALR